MLRQSARTLATSGRSTASKTTAVNRTTSVNCQWRCLHQTSIRRLSPLNAVSHEPVFFSKINVVNSQDETKTYDHIPAFRMLDGDGNILPDVPKEWKDKAEAIPDDMLIKMYKTMILMPVMDTILSSSQRQGRISFYMTSYGEEGAVVASAAAWENHYEVFAQYREVGVLLWRDYPLSSLMAQVFSTDSDTATLGRQMPVHYGSKQHHFHTISSPLGTQIPQAAGAAYALKSTPGKEDSCVVTYMGEGATSEGDFHAGLNMASVLGGPCVFFVRNNGFAISTPVAQQYKGDGIAARGPGYGIETIRVDGNDPLAVYVACVEARNKAVKEQKPVLVEAMSYRVGHHSTSDDSSAYRSAAAVDNIKKLDSPIMRLRRYLEQGRSKPLWSDEQEQETQKQHRQQILSEFSKAEKAKKPALVEMFKDVFAGGEELERPLREQKQELKRLIQKWGTSADSWRKDLEKFKGGKTAVDSW
ncbi:hypothetical protein OIO90_004451 [Microbotryomycetes sp. JL221]|nr:hypothetical protein OIO90_004451 [Microbotryomycetes sp. JL221]